MTALTRLVTEEKDNPKLRGSCYVAVGRILSTRVRVMGRLSGKNYFYLRQGTLF